MSKAVCELTREGIEKIKSQKDNLINRLRRIEAQMDDISLSESTSENIEFRDLMRERIGVKEEIKQLENTIKNAKVIRRRTFATAQPGCRINLENHELCYILRLVHSLEANSLEGKISSSSPLGASLLGKREGDEIAFTTPMGATKFNIVSIM